MPIECVCTNPACGKSFKRAPSQMVKGNVQFCSHACRFSMKSREELFWEKVLICIHGTDCIVCCWPWQAGCNHSGHGLFTTKIRGRKTRVSAHRVAWEFANNRSWPEELWGLHHCDNPPCCNPAHVYPGTALDNQRDVSVRGRRFVHVRARSTPLMYEPIDPLVSKKKAVPPIMHICQNKACRKSFRVAPNKLARGQGLYCSRPCADQGRTVFGLPLRPIAERFWEKVQRCEHGMTCNRCCWEWQGRIANDGFGGISMKTTKGWKNILVHRLAWELSHDEPIPAKHFVFHACEKKLCCNAKHLIIGKKENGRGVPVRRPLDERLWEKVQICAHGPTCPFCCWIWEGTVNNNDYGVMSLLRDGKRQNILTHRLAWELVNNRRMSLLLGILHHCDTPRCCNVWHLYPGTQKDNMRDAVRRNRVARIQPKLRGEGAFHAKLRDTDIPRIFDLRTEGWTLRKIAMHFHVSRNTITQVIQGQTWKHKVLASSVMSAGKVNLGLKIRAEDLPRIFAWHANGETRTSIAQRLHVSRAAIGRILAGKTQKHLTHSFLAEPPALNQGVAHSPTEQLLLPLSLERT